MKGKTKMASKKMMRGGMAKKKMRGGGMQSGAKENDARRCEKDDAWRRSKEEVDDACT